MDVLVEKVEVKPHPCWGNVKHSILYPVFFTLWFSSRLFEESLTHSVHIVIILALSVERLTTEHAQEVVG